MTNREYHCPKCNRYLGTLLTTDGTIVVVRTICRNCKEVDVVITEEGNTATAA